MAKLTDNKTSLQTLLTSLQEKATSSGPVTRVNGKTGDVNLELSDFNMTPKELKFTTADGSIATKKMVVCKPITFTIDGTEYQAEEGMTWGEWVESEYNTSTFCVCSSCHDTIKQGVGIDDEVYYIDSRGNVRPAELIEYATNYKLYGGVPCCFDWDDF